MDDHEIVYRPEKNGGLLNFLYYSGCCTSFWTCCFCMGLCTAREQYENHYTYITNEGVVVSRGENDCCCNVATKRTEIPYEKITDVSIERTCLLDCFNVTRITVQTAGTGTGAEGDIICVADSEEYRTKILEAKRNFMDAGKGMTHFQKLSPFSQIRELKSFHELSILTDDEFESAVQSIKESEAYSDEKAALLESLLSH